MEKKHSILILPTNKEKQPITFEWPTKEQIEEMPNPELLSYAFKLFDLMDKNNVPPDSLLPMMLDCLKARKSEKTLRRFMNNILDIFASECTQAIDISDLEA